uniref:helix-turn-helix domain-containing protein n=1 Tax=Oceanithermus sp. TaxID=2268145 RepID=UPI00257A29D6
MPRLTLEQWEEIRARYEGGASARELAREFGVSGQAISKRARKEGWSKGDITKAIVNRAKAKVDGVVDGANSRKKALAMDVAADKVADVIKRHRADWDAHRQRFGHVPEDFEQGKLAKISAEMLRIRHQGE